jgi:hypothetical protein
VAEGHGVAAGVGRYVAEDAAHRSKGTMYFVLHRHGTQMTGRWVGIGYDGPIVTGWGAFAKSEDGATTLVRCLKEKEPTPQCPLCQADVRHLIYYLI